MIKKILLIRGLSGSSKSTMAKYMAAYSIPCICYEADTFFVIPQPDGSTKYEFDASLLGKAHQWCLLNTEYAMRYNNNVIVSNTFTRWSEIRPYVNLALTYKYQVEILEPKTFWKYDPEECFKRNVHGVPLETIKRQRERWLHIPEGLYNPEVLLTVYGIKE